MKLYYRSALVWNLIYFLLLSIAFLYMIKNIGSSQSPFDLVRLENFLRANGILVLGATLICAIIFLSMKVSRYLFILFGLTCVAYGLYILFTDFSKISLVLLSFYTVLFYYSSQLLTLEVGRSYNNSGIKNNYLISPVAKKIDVCLYDSSKRGVSGYLVNWDEESCFVKLREKITFDSKASSFLVKGMINGYRLEDDGLIAAYDERTNSIGLKFPIGENSPLGWEHFFDIMTKLGLTPERIK